MSHHVARFALVVSAGIAIAAAPLDSVSPEQQSYLAHVAAAHASLRLNETNSAARWLEAAPQSHRGWEWNYLHAQIDQSVSRIEAHNETIFDLAISPDGRIIASCSGDKTIQLRDTNSRELVRELKGHEGPIYSIAFAPDGKTIASASGDRTVRLWNVESGEVTHTLRDFQVPVTAVAFTPDGKQIAACNYTKLAEPPHVDGTVKLWDVANCSITADLRGGGVKPLSSLAITRDGSHAVAGSWDGEVWIWNLKEQSAPRCVKLPNEGKYNAVNCIEISPDDNRIVSGAKDNAARVIDLQSGEIVRTLRHDGWVTGVAFSGDGARIATTSNDDLVRIWNAADGELISTLRGHTAGAWAVAFSRDDAQLFTAGQDKSIRQWDAKWRGYDGIKLKGPAGTYGLAFSADGTQLLINAYDATIRRFDLRDQKELAKVAAHDGSSNMMALSADGKTAVSCSWDKTLKFWNAQDLTMRHEIRFEKTAAYHCAISVDGSLAGAALGDGSAAVYRTDTGECIAELKGHEKGLHSIAFSVDATKVVTGAMDRTARVWNVKDGTCLHTLAHGGSVESSVFSPDGKLVVSSGGGVVHAWNAETGAEIWSTRVSDDAVQRVTCSPDGRRIAVAAEKVHLLDPATGAVCLSFSPFEPSPYNLVFNADGSMLAVCATEGDIAIVSTKSTREMIEWPKK